jgi:hypothetical protein
LVNSILSGTQLSAAWAAIGWKVIEATSANTETQMLFFKDPIKTPPLAVTDMTAWVGKIYAVELKKLINSDN